MRLARAIALALGVVVSLGISGLASLRPATALAAAPALPADRLHFGLSNGPGSVGWMTGSGVPWRYRYAYLAGGVNTPNDWTTWQDPALPPGQYAADYMATSSSGQADYIPVFTWYQLLQSSPSTGADESERDYNNLNNAATMSSYYSSFKLLLQKAGAYGKPVVVHVEPDFWGYMEQRSSNTTASVVGASVASSGFPDVGGFPNTVAGFGQALLHLRDLYASNVVMAIHASMWSTAQDVATSPDAALDARAEADKTSTFLNSAGSWDAVFNDVDDHDAGWWEKQGSSNHWWDPTNTRFPNFSRWLSWVAELHARTGRPQVVWQVPVGNQYYLTMNNTCGHYQDNVAQYFIAHTADLFAAGLIAVLFGAGNACQTTNEDSQNDGVTNSGGLPTSDSAGWCNQCNTHASTSADDDGGYLRTFVGAYYASTLTPPSYSAYFAWYDRASREVLGDNIHIVNPGPSTASGTVSITGVASLAWSAAPNGGEAVVSFPPGTIGGPVVVGADSRVIASQRVQFAQSFNEIPAEPAAAAARELFLPWFDRISSAGFTSDNIHLVNPGGSPALVRVFIPGQPGCSVAATVPPGGTAVVTCANGFGGPVRITSDQPVLASQRVNYFQSFNETWAQPRAKAGTALSFPWYDRISSSGFLNDNIHLVNPGTADAHVSVGVPGQPGCSLGPLLVPAGGQALASCPRGFGGPVTVSSDLPILASQRVQYFSSFNEVPAQGTPAAALKLYFPWYDRISDAGFQADNVHLVNPGPATAVISVSIPGLPEGCTSSGISIPAGGEVMVTCPTGFGGPVVVSATGNPVLASQRVQYYQSFNESAAAG